jgi:hypothetical protein
MLPMLALAVLASGCCCPPLSGRYEQAAMPALQSEAQPSAAAKPNSPHHDSHHRLHLGHRFGWHGMGDGPETPPGQHVPLPKFHPVPVRPVFEPQYDYSPALAYGPSLAPIVTPESLAAPPPVQPVPEPE